jgi:hypothetical protein
MVPAVEQTSGTVAGAAGQSSPTEEGQPAGAGAEERTSFASRGRARRRARYLRKARELAYRDLGGLVYNLHRFGQRNDQLVLAKLTTLQHIDGELRAIETAMGESEPLTVLREAGITACPRCASIHSSEDHFCPNCGLSLGPYAEHPAELRTGAPAPGPVSAPPSAVAAAPPAAVEPAPPPAEEPAPPPAAEPVPPPAAEGPATAPGEQAATPPAPAPAAPAAREVEDEATVITRPSAPGR